MNEDVLRRLTFLKKKMQKVQREVIEMESLVVKLDEEFYKNQKEIENLEWEIQTLKDCSIVDASELSNLRSDSRVIVNTGILKEHCFGVYDPKEKSYEARDGKRDHIELVTASLSIEDFNSYLRNWLLETKQKALIELKKKNEKLVADLESLTQDYKGE